MKLYSYWRSSSAWRVRIALHYKNIAHQSIPVHLVREGGQQYDPAFLARNPMAQVPVLEFADPSGATVSLTQSMAILEYLEDTVPTPPLLPREAVPRARTRQLAELINSGIQPLQNLKLQQWLRARQTDPAPFVTEFIAAGLHAVEALATITAGRFLVGDSPTFADLFLVPQLSSARRFDIDLRGFTSLLRVEGECESLPAFRAAHPNAQPDREMPPA